MKDTEQYCIVWQECGPDNQIAARFFVPGYEGFLPFFIWGEEKEALENKEKVKLREEHLLKGILYGLYEFSHHSKPWHQKKDRDTYLYLLDRLMNGFGFDDPEKMLLDTAFNVRDKNGSGASRIILETGNALMPQSSKIKSDLILDLWVVLSESEEKRDLLMEICDLVEQTDLAKIYSGAKEVVCYYGLCATVFLGRDIEDYMEKFIYPYVTLPNLKNRIFALLENPEGFTPADMHLT